ncbi:hypothetical protein HF086_017095 [Spodoptera exigua]|uniref:MTOR-associated protein MEAK7 n=1 Tax=Spodoptera exigua TaxID=7107 RepID=A0A922MNG4_SPOEX|nr:hypothetical protein HF086_017095 [Spodoptera exigua]
MMVAYNSLGMDFNDTIELPYQLLREYCESIASTYIKVLKSASTSRATTWIIKGFRGRASHVQALGEAIAASVEGDADVTLNACTSNQLNKWLQLNTLLRQMTEAVFVNLYGINKKTGDESPGPVARAEPCLMPLPIGRIQDQGASLLIIEDNSGYIFGGYAPASWSLGPNFVGNEESFLFTLAPKMRDERDLSVLDVNPEAKAILDMAGRTRHSEGLREPPPL